MKLTEKELQGLLPNLKGLAGIDPRAELRITEAFRRVYEVLMVKLKEQENSYEKKISDLNQAHKIEMNNLSTILVRPLVGSGVVDPELESLIQQFGPQVANHVFAGPTPTFRLLAAGDIPNLDASKINSGTFLLVRLDPKILKTDDGLTKVAGAPVADGHVVLKDNNGNTIKVMTTP